jgi:hypothetical protein
MQESITRFFSSNALKQAPKQLSVLFSGVNLLSMCTAIGLRQRGMNVTMITPKKSVRHCINPVVYKNARFYINHPIHFGLSAKASLDSLGVIHCFAPSITDLWLGNAARPIALPFNIDAKYNSFHEQAPGSSLTYGLGSREKESDIALTLSLLSSEMIRQKTFQDIIRIISGLPLTKLPEGLFYSPKELSSKNIPMYTQPMSTTNHVSLSESAEETFKCMGGELLWNTELLEYSIDSQNKKQTTLLNSETKKKSSLPFDIIISNVQSLVDETSQSESKLSRSLLLLNIKKGDIRETLKKQRKHQMIFLPNAPISCYKQLLSGKISDGIIFSCINPNNVGSGPTSGDYPIGFQILTPPEISKTQETEITKKVVTRMAAAFPGFDSDVIHDDSKLYSPEKLREKFSINSNASLNSCSESNKIYADSDRGKPGIYYINNTSHNIENCEEITNCIIKSTKKAEEILSMQEAERNYQKMFNRK